MSSANITLVVDGKELKRTWSDIRVRRSMESVCSSFDFNTVQETPDFKIADWPIRMGDTCDVLVDQEAVLKGYIEDVNINYDDKSHSVQVAGRDKTCDLIDCHKSDGHFEFGTTNKVTVLSIVKDICTPFGIAVTVDSSASEAARKLKSTFYIMPGDVNMGALYRITRWAKVYMLATTDGGLLLTLTGANQARVELKRGVNILKGGLKQSDKERFSVYRVRGYSTSTDNLSHSSEWLWMNGRFPASDPATYPDARTGATRYRPFSQMAETAVQIDNVGNMSKAEAQYRIGNSRKFSYTVQGWREADGGNLWAPNTLVYVTDPLTGLERKQLLVEAVEYVQSEQGTQTQLSLCFPDKYTALAEVNKIKTIFEIGAK